ncbi:hypothetical protein [Plastoroseomonas arctica]|uniref:Transmembrane protein n=1 Tax=Plastoroseomonas arctica TaxID=1509237 RepID=A0AAF1K5R9_9PROT|nr:hypothetical protein [Plastoroseomonas arctica]MBR0656870.1 hypothetical protein [Plastoroseomonas arctica]
MHPIIDTILLVAGCLLLATGMVFLVGGMVAIVQAWRNGLPWWSGGMMWFNTSLQPPAARPHIRAAWRRYGRAALFCFAGIILIALTSEQPSTLPNGTP